MLVFREFPDKTVLQDPQDKEGLLDDKDSMDQLDLQDQQVLSLVSPDPLAKLDLTVPQDLED